MKNKMATTLGNAFSTAENQVSQCDVGSTTGTLIIHFGQERFEQFLSGGSTSSLYVRKHRKVSVARAPLATSWKQVSIETTKVLCEPIREPQARLNRLHASLPQSQKRLTQPRAYVLTLRVRL